ncbi:MAG TPA: glutamine--fructose-6-phosphate transaminase (isomerizing) [Actinobacteria bacterium]|nr:glutamine--fructose-6-phosphate transaminase (isomerizing) [Actinomycetota bacterium]
MCGIVGYVGAKASAPILIKGLKRLEYRGYDSAGIAVLANGSLKSIRREGNLSKLENSIDYSEFDANLGIGHTRWATHGAPSEKNAHPHFDCQRRIAVVHNGIIENFHQLRHDLEKRGHTLLSDTDTEVIAHLIEDAYQGDLFEATKEAITHVEGSFGMAVISSDSPQTLIGVRQDSPLVVGISEQGFFVASDIPAILDYTREVVLIENGDIAELTPEKYRIESLKNGPVSRPSTTIQWNVSAAEKSGYEDFMLKEIHEQPMAVKETLRGRIDTDGTVTLPDLGFKESELKKFTKIIVVACGTSLHAGMLAKQVIERWVRMPVEVDCSSEFRYRNPIVDKNTLIVAITQSGETADTLAGIRIARALGSKILAITNVVGSTVTRESDGCIYTYAGPEIGVAATKTFMAQLAALNLLGLVLARVFGKTNAETEATGKELLVISDKIETVLGNCDVLKDWAQTYHGVEDFLFLGRGASYPMAMEGALKLKEISYIHAEGYPAGEMKHGPIALINSGLPIVVIAPKDSVYEKIVSNIYEAKARGATILAIATEGDIDIKNHVDDCFFIPRTLETLTPLLSVVPLQLLAYFIAKLRDCNVDQPRNLAKSVTVE